MSPIPSPAGRPPGARRSTAWRWSRRLLGVSAAVIAALIISFFTVDLGRIPGLKGAAERAASKYLDRPMHLGKIAPDIKDESVARDYPKANFSLCKRRIVRAGWKPED